MASRITARRCCEAGACIAIIYVSLAIVLAMPLMAADLSRDIREGRQNNSADVSAVLELGIGATFRDLPVVGAEEELGLDIALGGHIGWNGFFVDVLRESYSGFQIGYNLLDTEYVSVDLVGAVTELTIDDELSEDLEPLRDRDAGFNVGLRSTFYRGDNLLQLELLGDVSDTHDGYLMSAFAGRSWLYNNWNFHAILGARYWSTKSLDYFVGVTEEEATVDFPAYQADDGTTIVMEAGVTYPLAEHWIFRGTVRRWNVSQSINDSPFINSDHYSAISARFYFVY